jgi:carbonic anhydrase
MDQLIAGYRRFRANVWPERRRVFETLAENGQRPHTAVVACIDSRVDPAMIFDAGPGEILTIRNVANLVPPYEPDGAYHGTSAALEFAVRVLGVPHIVVLGHGACGGVRALIEGRPENARDFIDSWMSLAAPALDRVPPALPIHERASLCEREVIRISLANLLTFPWIRDCAAAGKLRLHGAWFAIDSGALEIIAPDGSFHAG